MRWRGERQSSNIEDRRGLSVGRVAAGGGLGTLVIMVLALLFGVNPSRLLEQVPSEQPPTTTSSRPQNAEEEELKHFVAVVLGKTEDVWSDVFRKNGRQYREPTLVLFTDQVRSACGIAGPGMSFPQACARPASVRTDRSGRSGRSCRATAASRTDRAPGSSHAWPRPSHSR